MRPFFILTSLILSTSRILSAQTLLDGKLNQDIQTSFTTNDFASTTIMVEIPKAKVGKRSNLSVVLRSKSKEKGSYVYIPLLVEDGDDVASWSTRTGQNVTRTWMRGRHGIFFATCKMPKSILDDFILEVLIGNNMNNPTYQYSPPEPNNANKT